MSLFENIYPTEHDVPETVKNFQDDVYGIGALCKAVKEMIDGETDTVIFKTGKHDGREWSEVGGFILTMETYVKTHRLTMQALKAKFPVKMWTCPTCSRKQYESEGKCPRCKTKKP